MKNLYSPFVSDPTHVRELQTVLLTTGALISGSKVTELLDRTNYRAKDLDIYVNSNSAHKFHDTLSSFNYTLETDSVGPYPSRTFTRTPTLDSDTNAYYSIPGIDVVLTYISLIQGLRIQVICCTHHPLKVILSFGASESSRRSHVHYSDSTAHALNFATSSTIHSLYPNATFLNHKSLRIHTQHEERAERWRMGYLHRGIRYTNGFDMNYTEASTSGFSSGTRFVGDNHCWAVPISQVTTASKDFFARVNSWMLQFCGPAAMIETCVISSPLFQQSYVCAPLYGDLIRSTARLLLDDPRHSSSGK